MSLPNTIEIVQGTLEFLILKTLGQGTPMHGFSILEWIYATTDGALQIEEGSLYPALHRMQKRKWIQAAWGISDKGRRAKYYALTRTGRSRLQSEEHRWAQYVAAVGKIVSRATPA